MGATSWFLMIMARQFGNPLTTQLIAYFLAKSLREARNSLRVFPRQTGVNPPFHFLSPTED
ncbi:hypothetical protein NC651_021249 [Populus alba x Populus x berolinensis]|nr:hypothetical protein NC651_021249 [Populus alba x Populus x berolinensis]